MNADHLNAPTEFNAWLEIARLRISNEVRVEIRLPPAHSDINSAVLGLHAETLICQIAVSGGKSIDINVIGPNHDKPPYGMIEYIVDGKNLTSALRCKDIAVHNSSELRLELDKCLDDFLTVIAQVS